MHSVMRKVLVSFESGQMRFLKSCLSIDFRGRLHLLLLWLHRTAGKKATIFWVSCAYSSREIPEGRWGGRHEMTRHRQRLCLPVFPSPKLFCHIIKAPISKLKADHMFKKQTQNQFRFKAIFQRTPQPCVQEQGNLQALLQLPSQSQQTLGRIFNTFQTRKQSSETQLISFILYLQSSKATKSDVLTEPDEPTHGKGEAFCWVCLPPSARHGALKQRRKHPQQQG